MGAGIGIFVALGKWDLGHWDWDLGTGNGEKNVEMGMGDIFSKPFNHDQSIHHSYPGVKKCQKFVL